MVKQNLINHLHENDSTIMMSDPPVEYLKEDVILIKNHVFPPYLLYLNPLNVTPPRLTMIRPQLPVKLQLRESKPDKLDHRN